MLVYKFLQERVLTHDAADSANWQTLCALQIFCIVYCIVLYWWSFSCKVGAFYD